MDGRQKATANQQCRGTSAHKVADYCLTSHCCQSNLERAYRAVRSAYLCEISLTILIIINLRTKSRRIMYPIGTAQVLQIVLASYVNKKQQQRSVSTV